MTFEDVLAQAIAMLQRRGRLTYRTLQRQFQLDDAALEDLKDELIYGQRLAVDEDGRVLVWSGTTVSSAAIPVSPSSGRPPLAYTPPYLAEKILTSRSALEGERKLVTVLFADLRDSMELLAERDPEDARRLLDPVRQYATEVQRTQGVPIHIRVGLNAGEVVVWAIGSDLYMDYTAVGQTTHLATRMEQMAMPGSILITSAVLALALTTASGEVVLQALANLRLGAATQAQGDYRRAIDYLSETMASLEGARRHERFGQVILPAVACRALLAACHAELGIFVEGCALGDEGLRIAEAVAHPGSLMLASWGIGLLTLYQGDLPRALPLLERAVGICQDVDSLIWFPMMAAALGAAYTLGGHVADAVSLLMRAMEQTIVMKRVDLQALCGLSLGEAHTLTKHASALAREHQERGNEAYALRLFSDIAARRESLEHQQAEAHYQQALALAEELGMRPLQAHCPRGLGTLYATSGQQEQACTELSTAMEMYRTMKMTFWLPQVEAVLAQVE
jgi:class 3 adenylate cyclase